MSGATAEESFDRVFQAAMPLDPTGKAADPYPWQRRFVLCDPLHTVVDAPTGSGKTEAAVLSWLWRRRLAGDTSVAAATPRRLAIALPMRVLVEQTQRRVEAILERLEADGLLDPDRPVKVSTLLGGDADDGWALEPGGERILVGTIDMLLSRALNRGYGLGRASWPVAFGLLNLDTQWVLDEVQLLDAAVATSCQLQAFRCEITRPGEPVPETVWMSATIDPAWLETVDHPRPTALLSVDSDDERGSLGRRLFAPKELARKEIDLFDNASVATVVLSAHAAAQPGLGEPPWLTLAICNTVARARALYDTVERTKSPDTDLVLLHSRFRTGDRARALARVEDEMPSGGRIVVTTQVIEAGVDIDAAAIVTELAPWANIVQRAGRLNRAGARAKACLTLIDPPGDLEKLAAPYEPTGFERSRESLRELDGGDVSPRALREIARSRTGPVNLLEPPRQGLIPRRRDLLTLFDTDPTLDGEDSDVGAMIRLSDDIDVSVAWRHLSVNERPDAGTKPPHRDELCPVPISDRQEIARLEPWRWSYATRAWDRVNDPKQLRPGDLLLCDADRGGYDPDRGWDPRSGEVTPVPVPAAPGPDSDNAERLSEGCVWLTVAEHTDNVVAAVEESLRAIGWLDDEERKALRLAARWHDSGKSHERFQERLIGPSKPTAEGFWAKAPEYARPTSVFRHEVASVLMLLEARANSIDRVSALALYLIGSHHGKLRLVPRVGLAGQERSCLGVKEGEAVPRVGHSVELGASVTAAPITADLAPFGLGNDGGWSWTESALDLLAWFGPFRLAYLESLLRGADWRASSEEDAAHE